MSEDKMLRVRNRLYFENNVKTFEPFFEKYTEDGRDVAFTTARDITAYIRQIIESDDACFLAWQRNGTICGYVLATLERRGASGISEVVIWQTIAGDSDDKVKRLMVETLEGWAKERGARVIRFNTTHTKAMKRIMGKLGFKPTITIFEKGVG